MENNTEKQQNKRPFIKDEGQKFYFNEDGKLVVESNKGIWVDGEHYVKMYGKFTCNAKTLGIIINKFKGCPVMVKGMEWDDAMIRFGFSSDWADNNTAIINPTEEEKGLFEEIERQKEQIKSLQKESDSYLHKGMVLTQKVDAFNAMPWYKRIFKKVEV